jgi:N-sulfoglucosamine sulfohydrolase
MYQTNIDAHQHRSHRSDGYQLPGPIKLVTEYFKAAEYYIANVTQPAPEFTVGGK